MIPKSVSSVGDPGSHLIMVRRAPRVRITNGISIGPAVLAQLMLVIKRQMDRHTDRHTNRRFGFVLASATFYFAPFSLLLIWPQNFVAWQYMYACGKTLLYENRLCWPCQLILAFALKTAPHVTRVIIFSAQLFVCFVLLYLNCAWFKDLGLWPKIEQNDNSTNTNAITTKIVA